MDLLSRLKDRIEDRLHQAGEAILQAQREALSDSGSDEVRSRPGEAPRRQTGKLANSFSYSVVDGALTLTSDCPYWQFLQNGTAKIAPRDVLAGYHAEKNHIIDIIAGRA